MRPRWENAALEFSFIVEKSPQDCFFFLSLFLFFALWGFFCFWVASRRQTGHQFENRA